MPLQKIRFLVGYGFLLRAMRPADLREFGVREFGVCALKILIGDS